MGHSSQFCDEEPRSETRRVFALCVASWCYSCREEARDFEAFWQRYKDKGIVVAGIAIQDTPEAARQFATALFRHPGRLAALRGAEQASRP